MNRTAAIIRGTVILVVVAGGVGWFLWRRYQQSADRGQFLLKWGLTAAILVLAGFTIDFSAADAATQIAGVIQATVYGLLLAILWAGSIAEAFANKIGALFDGGDIAADAQPAYSIAEARIKQGKYQEALYEIQAQLARFPRDITGQMMMAEIQAAHLGDLDGAEATVARFCQQPDHTPQQIAGALNLLADLHLQHGRDPEAARRAFEMIIARLPDTPEAHQAQQRIAHLASPERLMSNARQDPIRVAPGQRDVGLAASIDSAPDAASEAANQAAEEQVAAWVNRLELHPHDDEAREKLAVLYAEHYRSLDLAAEQLEFLVHQPNPPPKLVVHWLNLLADLQVRLGAEFATVQATLQRIIDLNPAVAAAENARQRLNLLKLEYKRNEESQSLRLGFYEKDLGLRQRPHRGRE